jgi:hypothetical protein
LYLSVFVSYYFSSGNYSGPLNDLGGFGAPNPQSSLPDGCPGIVTIPVSNFVMTLYPHFSEGTYDIAYDLEGISINQELLDVMKEHAQWFTEWFGQTLPEHFLFPPGNVGPVTPPDPPRHSRPHGATCERKPRSVAASMTCATRPSPNWPKAGLQIQPSWRLPGTCPARCWNDTATSE